TLFADRIEYGGTPLFQFAQIAQALVEGAQLRVVERAGRLLAIAGDERHRRAAIEQHHRGGDLLLADVELLRDLSVNGSRHARTFRDGHYCGGAGRCSPVAGSAYGG